MTAADTGNPLPIPEATPINLGYEAPTPDPIAFSPKCFLMLKQTKPWARFLAIMMFIGTGFMALGGIIAAATVALSNGPKFSIMISFIYILMAAFYFPAALYLNRYASRIGDLLRLHRTISLEEALQAQKSFWRFCGIAMIAILGCYILFGIGVVVYSILHI